MLEMCFNEWKKIIRIITSRTFWNVVFAILAFPWECWDAWHWRRFATSPDIPCSCGEAVSLVGEWRCRCGYTYQGHLMRTCPVCRSMPRMVRCYNCGLTTKLPDV